jgi:tetratricopeptide (TPR) repeat protein
MNTPHVSIIFTLVFALNMTADSQPKGTPSPARAARPPAFVHLGGSSSEFAENQDDPGFALYKAGYSYVLDGQWGKAREQFAELISNYPTSEYLDDAQYWSAYSLLNGNAAKEAIDAYRSFIDTYPTSSYYDDAVADLSEAQAELETPQPGHAPMALLREQLRGLSHLSLAGTPWNLGTPHPDMEADPETQLRIDALNAIGDGAEDQTSFETLKEVAVNQRNPVVLRAQAIEILGEFKKFDPFPLFVEIARKDTVEEMRYIALDHIADFDKTRSVDALIEIFHSIPPKNREQTSRVFYSIAEVGNDKAVDFLSGVAKTHSEMAFRREAVYYLGAIGSEKARKALYEILKGK